jgi:hypothetical protein
MRREVVWTLLATCAPVAIPPAAGAYVPNHGAFFQERIVTFNDQTNNAYGGAARMGIASWNATGMRLTLVPAPWPQALIRIRSVGRGREGLNCVGAAGATAAPPDGLGGIAYADVAIVRGCRDRALFRQITTHEIGHAIGLGHERRRCSTMVPSNDVGARRCGKRWLQRCLLVQADDIAGVVRYYGGRRRSLAAVRRAACLDGRPRRAGGLRVDPDPVGTIATAGLRVSGRGGVAVIVGRRRGPCPSSPTDPRAEFYYALPTARRVPAFGLQAIPGSWCYRSWRVSAGGRWSPPSSVRVAHGARTAALRIGLTVAAAPGGQTITYTQPAAPAGWRTNVEFRTGTCAAPETGGTIDFGTFPAGAVRTVTDGNVMAAGATRCYRVLIHDGTYPDFPAAFVAEIDYQAA